MLAELHLAEDAFALHLLLQHLKGLVNIVVTDENLHVAFLFFQPLINPMAKTRLLWRKRCRYPIPTLSNTKTLSLSQLESSIWMNLYSIQPFTGNARPCSI
jgi:hypothetical protein